MKRRRFVFRAGVLSVAWLAARGGVGVLFSCRRWHRAVPISAYPGRLRPLPLNLARGVWTG